MIVSLQQFLETGTIGNLRLGVTAEDVRELLGPPDDVGGTSRKYPRPSIYVYGSVELFFSQSRPARCVGIWWYAHRGPFCLTTDATQQLLSPGMRREEVEARLTNAGLTFHAPAHEERIVPTLVLASGVTVVLHEDDGGLYSVASYGG